MEKLRYFYDDGGPRRERHLVCFPYSIENLHKMARDLGIGSHWFHSGDKPHYDVPKRMMKKMPPSCSLVQTEEIIRIIKGERPSS